MILYAFCFFLFFWSITSFFQNKKDVLSPSFVMIATFFVGSVFSLIGNQLYWHQNISGLGPMVIVLSLAFFQLGERCFEMMQFSNLPKTQLFLFKRTIDQRPMPLPIHFSKKTFFIMLIYQIVGVGLIIYFELQILKNANYSFGSFSFMSVLRQQEAAGEKLPSVVSAYGVTLIGISLFGFFTIAQCLYENKENKAWKLPLLFLLVFPGLFYAFISRARSAFLLDAIFFASSLLISKRENSDRNKTKLTFLLVCIGGFFLIFYSIVGVMSKKITNQTGFFQVICIYAGSSIIAFDKYLTAVPSTIFSSPWGQETFFGILNLFHRFFPSSPSGTYFLEVIHFTNGDSTNIYTAFRSFVHDFGVLGAVFIPFFCGIYAALAHKLAFVSKGQKSLIIKAYYCLYLNNLVYSLFTPQMTSSFLTITEILLVTTLAACLYLPLLETKATGWVERKF